VNRTVILKHSLPDGSWHYDWLIQINQDDAMPLLTFRTGHRRPDELGNFQAERISDHRAFYLDYEGPISEGRGEVIRVAAGEVVSAAISRSAFAVVLAFDDRKLEFAGAPIGEGRWSVTVAKG